MYRRRKQTPSIISTRASNKRARNESEAKAAAGGDLIGAAAALSLTHSQAASQPLPVATTTAQRVVRRRQQPNFQRISSSTVAAVHNRGSSSVSFPSTSASDSSAALHAEDSALSRSSENQTTTKKNSTGEERAQWGKEKVSEFVKIVCRFAKKLKDKDHLHATWETIEAQARAKGIPYSRQQMRTKWNTIMVAYKSHKQLYREMKVKEFPRELETLALIDEAFGDSHAIRHQQHDVGDEDVAAEEDESEILQQSSDDVVNREGLIEIDSAEMDDNKDDNEDKYPGSASASGSTDNSSCSQVAPSSPSLRSSASTSSYSSGSTSSASSTTTSSNGKREKKKNFIEERCKAFDAHMSNITQKMDEFLEVFRSMASQEVTLMRVSQRDYERMMPFRGGPDPREFDSARQVNDHSGSESAIEQTQESSSSSSASSGTCSSSNHASLAATQSQTFEQDSYDSPE